MQPISLPDPAQRSGTMCASALRGRSPISVKYMSVVVAFTPVAARHVDLGMAANPRRDLDDLRCGNVAEMGAQAGGSKPRHETPTQSGQRVPAALSQPFPILCIAARTAGRLALDRSRAPLPKRGTNPLRLTTNRVRSDTDRARRAPYSCRSGARKPCRRTRSSRSAALRSSRTISATSSAKPIFGVQPS